MLTGELDGPRNSASLTTAFTIEHNTLLIDLGKRRTVLSSAPRGGGISRVRYVLNHQVQGDPIIGQPQVSPCTWEDPARYLGRVAMRLGVDSKCVALMTAVPMEQLVVLREEAEGIWLEGFFTVGVSNAVRAGERVSIREDRVKALGPGTINIILVTSARLAIPAMVGAVQVATESKAATLLSERVPSWTGRKEATGTGTDAIVIVSGDGPARRYSGTHTAIGEMIGRLVGQGVLEGLVRYRRWASRLSADKRLSR